MLAYAPLVKYVAGRMSSGLPAHVEEADLISYGLLGLISAIERFEPAREIRFETFAITRIKGSIIDELRSLDWVPALRAREGARDREGERQARAPAPAGRRPTRRWRTRWSTTVDDFQDSLVRISNSSVVALDELWTVSDASGDQVSLLDTIQDPAAVDPAQEMDLTDMKDRLADAIARLPEREKLVVALYYYENLTLREIGEVLGVTESRVSQLHTKAVLRLKSRLQGDSLTEVDLTLPTSRRGAVARAPLRRRATHPAPPAGGGGGVRAPSARRAPRSRSSARRPSQLVCRPAPGALRDDRSRSYEEGRSVAARDERRPARRARPPSRSWRAGARARRASRSRPPAPVVVHDLSGGAERFRPPRGLVELGCAARSASRSGVHGQPAGVLAGGQPADGRLLRGRRALPPGRGEHARRRHRARPCRAGVPRRALAAAQGAREGVRERGALPGARRHAPGVHLDRGRQGHGRLHQPRLARVHGPHARGGARRHLGRSACTPTTRRACARTWWRAFQRRVPWEREYRLRRHDGHYRWIVDRGVPRFRGERAGGLRRHGHRHPRAQGDGGEAEPWPPRATTRWRRPSSARCCRKACRRSTASSWRRATCPPAGARRSAATGTTRSSSTTAGSRWWSATWSATACARPR